MHQLVADWVDEMIVFLFYFDSQKKAGSLNIFFILKYRVYIIDANLNGDNRLWALQWSLLRQRIFLSC